MSRLLVAVGVVAMSLAACGDGPSVLGTVPGAPADGEHRDAEQLVLSLGSLDETAGLAARSLVEAHGADGGFAALVWAMERGYTIDQIVTGAPSGRVDSDGTIRGPDGQILEPGLPPLDLVLLPEDAQAASYRVVLAAAEELVFAQADDRFEPLGLLAQLQDELGSSIDPDEDPAAVLIALIVQLAQVGYGLDQIVDALILGDASVAIAGGCFVLSRGVGLTVIPAIRTDHPCSGLIADLESEGDGLPPSSTGIAQEQGSAAALRVYEQELADAGFEPGSLFRLEVESAQASLTVQIVTTASIPADDFWGAECRTDQIFSGTATFPVPGDIVDHEFQGSYSVADGTCESGRVVTGEESAHFAVQLELGSNEAAGVLRFTSPTLESVGFPEYELQISAPSY